MKKTIFSLFLLLFLSPVLLMAQQEAEGFNPRAFITSLSSELRRAGCENCKESGERLEALAEGNFLDSLKILEIKERYVELKRMKMRTGNEILHFVQALTAVAEKYPAHYSEWMDLLVQLIQAGWSNSELDRFFLFSTAYFSEGKLFEHPGRNWSLSAIDPQIHFEQGILYVDLRNVNLRGSSSGDSLDILEVSGRYFPALSLLKGSHGKITWANAGFDPKKVYAVFDSFEIKLAAREFKIEEATLHYAEKFNKPIAGTLIYKLISGGQSGNSDYPMFITEDKNLEVKNIMDGVQYIGGFTIRGTAIQGSGSSDEPARLLFRNKAGVLVAEARARSFLIKEDDAISTEAEFFLFFDKDTIYHPGVEMRYRASDRLLSLLQGKAGISKAPFENTYQNIDMDVKRISWDLDGQKIYMINRTAMSVHSPPAFFKSKDFFDKSEYLGYQGALSYNPISSLAEASRRMQLDQIYARNLIPFFNKNLSVQQLEPLLFQMVADGFIYYDTKTRLVTIRRKVKKYVLANAKKIDFDYISIKSESDSQNAILNLQNRILSIFGVYGVTLSAKHYVHFFPIDKRVDMGENRDMRWNGTLFAGNIDYYGDGFYFDYERFAIRMDSIDSMVINVPTGEVDEYGSPILKPLNSALEGLTGTLYIDVPINKSGYLNIPGYPKFDNSSTAYTYYDKKKRFKDVYKPDSFHFAVDTFSLDSLNSFSFGNQEFSGRFRSAGIFPELREHLVVMDDGSLGFESETPDTGLSTYGGVARYRGDLKLSNRGLQGQGEIDYLNARITASDLLFMPKITQSSAADLRMERRLIGNVDFPSVAGDSLRMDWLPYQDSMILHQQGEKFQLFDELVQHKGSLVLTSKGLRGSGTSSWDMTSLRSDVINFGGRSIQSDTALFRIKSDDEKRDVFNLSNAYAHIDFEKMEGSFRSNVDEATYLPFNLYNITFNRFHWNMKDSIIRFEAPKESKYSEFLSLHGRQDSLRFKGTGGSYNLSTLTMIASGVPHIAVGDVYVIPNSGQVRIGESANMLPLKGAKVLMDSSHRSFTLYDANIKILGRKDLKGEGKYDYINRSGVPQVIDFPLISTYHRSNEDTSYTLAEGVVYDSMNFMLDPQIRFRGDVYLHSKERFPQFKGSSRLLLPEGALVRSSWFRINNLIDPKNVEISAYHPLSYQGDSIYTGIHLRYDSTNLYATLIGSKVNYLDYTVMSVNGILRYLDDEKAYIVGDSAFLNGKKSFGDLFRYETETGNIHVEGQSNLGLDFDLVSVNAYGSIDKSISDTSYHFKSLMALDFFMGDEYSKELAADMRSQAYRSGRVDYLDKDFKRYFYQFLGDENRGDELYAELQKSGTLNLPKKFKPARLLLSDLEYFWNEETSSYMGKGECGVVMLGDKEVGRKMKYYVEFGFRRGNDYFSIYLLAPTGEWYFITYENKSVKVLTSNFRLNGLVINAKSKDRRKKLENGTITFTISSEIRQERFVQKMEYYTGELR